MDIVEPTIRRAKDFHIRNQRLSIFQHVFIRDKSVTSLNIFQVDYVNIHQGRDAVTVNHSSIECYSNMLYDDR